MSQAVFPAGNRLPSSSCSERTIATFGRGCQLERPENFSNELRESPEGDCILESLEEDAGRYEDVPSEAAACTSANVGLPDQPKLDDCKSEEEPKSLMRPVNFTAWAEQFVRKVLGAKTRFSFF